LVLAARILDAAEAPQMAKDEFERLNVLRTIAATVPATPRRFPARHVPATAPCRFCERPIRVQLVRGHERRCKAASDRERAFFAMRGYWPGSGQ
jgi:hypothetical protein